MRADADPAPALRLHRAWPSRRLCQVEMPPAVRAKLMSGPVEEAGRAANTFMEVMRSQPLSLALVLMNLGLLGFLYYQGSVAASERHHELDLLYENRKYVGELLHNCYPAPPEKK